MGFKAMVATKTIKVLVTMDFKLMGATSIIKAPIMDFSTLTRLTPMDDMATT
jgi:hypothetical protein